MSEVPYTTVAFMNSLADAIPEVGHVIGDTRRRHHGRPLPHVEMGDLTRWFIAQFRVSRTGGPHRERARETMAQFLWILEASFQVGDQPMDDLIATSFLENLQGHGSTSGEEELVAIRELLPEKMSAWYAAALE